MDECCKNCKWFVELRHNFTPHKGYEKSSCCFAMMIYEGGNGFVLEVPELALCENYCSKYADIKQEESTNENT